MWSLKWSSDAVAGKSILACQEVKEDLRKEIYDGAEKPYHESIKAMNGA